VPQRLTGSGVTRHTGCRREAGATLVETRRAGADFPIVSDDAALERHWQAACVQRES